MSKRTPDSPSPLSTTVEVMKALGGIRDVSALTGSGYKATENWSRAQTFPARFYLVMIRALQRKRLTAPPELWGMVAPASPHTEPASAAHAAKQRIAS